MPETTSHTPETMPEADLYGRISGWTSDGGAQAAARLARIDAPRWCHPYRLAHAADLGLALLGRAARNPVEGGGGRDLWVDMMRLALTVGRHALDRTDWTDGYVGMPLLAAHMVARSHADVIAEILDTGHAPVLTSLQTYIHALWPTPGTAQPPGDVRLALDTHRKVNELGLYEEIPGLRELIRAGKSTGQDRYAACIGRMLQRVSHDTSPRRQEAHALALAELVKEHAVIG
jgi:hypothetical protein